MTLFLQNSCSRNIVSNYKDIGNKQVLEKINVKKLLKTKSKEDNYEKHTVVKQYGRDSELHSLSYVAIDKKTNKRTTYLWMRESFIYKNILQTGNLFQEYFTYFGNGNLKSRYTAYIGNWKKIGDVFLPAISTTIVIGKQYEYDIDGQIIKIIDHDDNYQFSVYDVIDLMKRKYSKSEFQFRITQEKIYRTENYYWEVIYRVDDKHPFQVLHIDAKTGKVTEKGDRIIIE